MKNSVDTNRKNINYYSSSIKESENSMLSFLKWFNGGSNIQSIVNAGYYDFFNNILKSRIYSKTKINSKELVCLEIGCGGGRILNAACKYFGKAIGVDIHDSFNNLREFLRIENNNFELHKIIDNKVPIADNSVDVIYSFIVFQHILKIETFYDYVRETKRLLNKQGIAIIYIGRPRLLSKKNFNNKILNTFAFLLDKYLYERIYLNVFRRGYCEDTNAKVNHVNLMISLQKSKKVIQSHSFRILEKGYSHKNNHMFGTQYYYIIEHK